MELEEDLSQMMIFHSCLVTVEGFVVGVKGLVEALFETRYWALELA